MDNEELTVGLFEPGDAEGVARLFTEVYGDAYPAKIVYDPKELVEAFGRRDQIPVVVRTRDNRVIGYSSLFRAAPDKGVYEKGNGAVSPAFRNAGVMGMIFQYVGKTVPGIEGVKVFFGEPVCNHVYIQKAALAHLPFIETALEVDLMPAEAYVKEKSASGRVATLLMFITVVPNPHIVHVPDVYAPWFDYIYAGLDDRRSFAPAAENLPVSGQTRIDTEVYDFARVARVTVHDVGTDLPGAFEREEERVLREGVEVVQVFLKLSWPWVGRVADLLRDRGYFFGGILPQWVGGDGFLMQKTVSRPNWEDIHVHSERAKEILEFAKSDWRRSGE
jgi:hypothetical protein